MKIGIKDGETFRIYKRWEINLALWLMWLFGVITGVVVACKIISDNLK